MPDDKLGPVKSALLSFGPVAGKYEGAVLGLGIGCFGELLLDSMKSARLLHPRKRRKRAPELTDGPGAAPGDETSKSG